MDGKGARAGPRTRTAPDGSETAGAQARQPGTPVGETPRRRPGVNVDAARRLSNLGFAVHWCRGKAPIAKGWQKAPWCKPEHLDHGHRPGLNLGLHCGLVEGAPLSVVVVDLDSAEALAVARERLPPTPLRTLTRKGEHWLYRHPGPGHVIASKVRLGGLALDVRGDAGNAIVAPSVHPDDGSAYREATPWSYEGVQALPVFDPAWLSIAEQIPLPAPPPIDDDRLRRAAAYLRKTPGAIQGKAGDLCTFKAAVAVVRGFAVTDEAAALRLLLDEFNPRCVPPWDEAALRHKVRKALTSTGRTLGYLLERIEITPIVAPGAWSPGRVPAGAGRWSKTPTEVLWSGLESELKVLYMQLLAFQWGDGSIFPSAETLAGDFMSDKQVRTNLRRLEDVGLIVVTERVGRTPIIDCLHGKQSSRRPRKPSSGVASAVAPEAQRRRPRKPSSDDS